MPSLFAPQVMALSSDTVSYVARAPTPPSSPPSQSPSSSQHQHHQRKRKRSLPASGPSAPEYFPSKYKRIDVVTTPPHTSPHLRSSSLTPVSERPQASKYYSAPASDPDINIIRNSELPSPPLVIPTPAYNPEFGDLVTAAFEQNRQRHENRVRRRREMTNLIRANKYGKEAAAKYTPGSTPPEMKQAYQDRLARITELQEQALAMASGSEDEEDGQDGQQCTSSGPSVTFTQRSQPEVAVPEKSGMSEEESSNRSGRRRKRGREEADEGGEDNRAPLKLARMADSDGRADCHSAREASNEVWNNEQRKLAYA